MLKSEICPSHDVSRLAYDVVIPCYNRAATVERALDSVLAQAVPPSRVILVDDGSTDHTGQVLADLERRHRQVQAVLLPRNGGASTARNAGLALAREDWIAFLDSDDVWLPGAAEALLGAASTSDVVVGRFQRSWPCGSVGQPECGWEIGDALAALALGGAIGPSWSIVRRSLARRIAGFDPSFHNCNDWDFYVRLAAEGARFARVDATVALYHVAESNRLSHDHSIGIENARRVQAHPFLTNYRQERPQFELAG